MMPTFPSRLLLGAAVLALAFSTGIDQAATGEERFIVDTGLLVAVSKSGKTVYGFSRTTGELSKVTIDEEVTKPITPIVADEVACFVVGNAVYAYGAESGKWAKVVVDEKVKLPISPAADGRLVSFVAGTKAYAFGANSKKWAVADLETEGEVPTFHGQGFVHVKVESKLFLFSVASEQWAVADLSAE